LGMTKVMIHPFSSLLSAYGMGLADIRATRQQAIEEPFGDGALASIAATGGRLGADAKGEVASQGIPPAAITVHIRAHIRYAGTDTALVVPAYTLHPAQEGEGRSRRERGAASGAARNSFLPAELRSATSSLQAEVGSKPHLLRMKSAFEAAHQARFGFIDESKQLVVEAVSVEAIGGGAEIGGAGGSPPAAPPPPAPPTAPLLSRRG